MRRIPARLIAWLRRKQRGPFRDTITVHTSPSGTQYVDPLDLMFSPEELREAARRALGKA